MRKVLLLFISTVVPLGILFSQDIIKDLKQALYDENYEHQPELTNDDSGIKRHTVVLVDSSKLFYPNNSAESVDGMADETMLETLDNMGSEDIDTALAQTQDSTIIKFYRLRNYQPLWINDTGLESQSLDMLDALKLAKAHGLPLKRYKYSNLQSIYDTFKQEGKLDNNVLVYFEIEMSKAALLLSKDLRLGVIAPKSLPYSYEITTDEVNIPELLNGALVQKQSFKSFFNGLTPNNKYYHELRNSLTAIDEFIDRKNGAAVEDLSGDKLEFGAQEDRVSLMRKKLKLFYRDMSKEEVANSPEFHFSPIGNFSNVPEDEVPCIDEIRTGQDTMIYLNSQAYDIGAFGTDAKLMKIDGDSFSVEKKMVFEPALFDSVLLKYVKKYQADMGLVADGVIGRNTFKQLNRPIEDYRTLIEINLDRWRHLPRDMGENFILVNIPGFYLDVFEGDSSVLNKIVVVGAKKTETPIFNDQLKHIVINPTWTVPYSISSEEILPKLQNDPSYLERNNYVLLSGGSSISAYSVDWNSITVNSFPYVVRQNPGNGNSLGRIKFMFPNRHNVYLHDTPSKSKFKRGYRALSHGCVRLQNPMELAEYLFRNDAEWTAEKLATVKKSRKTKQVNLDSPIPIYIAYFTAYINQENKLNYAQDVYGLDKKLIPMWKETMDKVML